MLQNVLGFRIKTALNIALTYQNSLKKKLTLTVHGFIFGRVYYRKDICVCDLGGLFLGGIYIIYRNLTVF